MPNSCLIIYSTISGNTELVVQKVASLLQQKQISTTLERVENTDVETLSDYSIIILASPTYSQGDLEAQFKPFLKKLADKDISQMKFAIIGLGDNQYYPEYLTESASILEKIIIEAGAKIVVPSVRIGMPPIKFIDKLIPKWVDKLVLEF